MAGVRGRTAVAALALMILAGCGSTLSASQQDPSKVVGQATQTAAPLSLGGTTDSGSGTSGAGAASGVVGSPGSADSAATGASGTGPLASPSTTSVGGGAGGTAAGVADSTAKGAGTIKIGIPYADDTAALETQFGDKNVNSSDPAGSVGDFEKEVNAIFAYINRHGGLAGHTVVPVYDLYRFESDGNFSNSMQAMCTYYTEDQPVFAVVFLYGNAYDPLPECLSQHHTMLILDTNSAYYDPAEIAGFGNYYYRPFMTDTSAVKAQIDGLDHFGWLKQGEKIGVLRWDDPQGTATYNDIVVPELSKYGLKPHDTFAYSYLDSVADLSTAESQSANAVLKFDSEGITHIITVASNSVFPDLFAESANTQHYYPDYGLSSMDIPGAGPGALPTTQVENMVAIGWNRAWDIDWNATTPADAKLPAYERCMAILNPAGVVQGNGFACALGFWMQKVLAGTTSPSAAAFRAGVNALGTSFQNAPQTDNLDFLPGSTNGITTGHYVTYVASCSCMQYTGAPYAIEPG